MLLMLRCAMFAAMNTLFGRFVAFCLAVVISGFVQDLQAQISETAPDGLLPVKAKPMIEVPLPAGWLRMESDPMVKNLTRLDLTKEALALIIQQGSGQAVLLTYVKHDPKIHAGIIPTIKVAIRSNPTNNYTDFQEAMYSAAQSLMKVLPGAELTQAPKEVTVASIPSVQYVLAYPIDDKRGGQYNVRNRMYMIPSGRFFFQVTFMDTADDDCSAVFDELVTAIRL